MDEPLKIVCRKCLSKLDVSDFEPFSELLCPSCGTKLRVPKRYDRYLLERLCGRGGMSKVYRAIEPELSRRVAVKIKDSVDKEGKIAEDFVREARLVGQIDHRSIVPVYNCGSCEGHSFLVMRYMEHGDLEYHMKNGTLPELPLLLSWIASIIPGLMEGQKLKIVHHDIKPSNIMLTAGNEAKLGDFDLAEIREPGDLSTPCAEWGSPAYASPERLFGGGEDSRGDIFSLGATLYELLTGIAPFGIQGSAQLLYEKRRMMSFRPLIQLKPEAGALLSQTVQAALDFAPENRPRYSEILNALNQTVLDLQAASDAQQGQTDSADRNSTSFLSSLWSQWFHKKGKEK